MNAARIGYLQRSNPHLHFFDVLLELSFVVRIRLLTSIRGDSFARGRFLGRSSGIHSRDTLL